MFELTHNIKKNPDGYEMSKWTFNIDERKISSAIKYFFKEFYNIMEKTKEEHIKEQKKKNV